MENRKHETENSKPVAGPLPFCIFSFRFPVSCFPLFALGYGHDPRRHVLLDPATLRISARTVSSSTTCKRTSGNNAIWLQNIYSVSGYTRAELVYNKAKLYEIGGTLPDQHYKWDVKKAAAESAAGGHH